MLGFIRRTISRDECILTTLKSLYVSLVRSHLEYASEIWSPRSVTLIKRIESVQRRATRLLLPDLTYTERLHRLDLLPLVHRREVKDLSTFYKMKCGYYDCDIETYVQFCSDTRLRSFSQGKLKLSKCRTELFKGTYFNRIPYLWNNLPQDLRTSTVNPGLFTKKCKEHYKTKVYDPDRPHVSWTI